MTSRSPLNPDRLRERAAEMQERNQQRADALRHNKRLRHANQQLKARIEHLEQELDRQRRLAQHWECQYDQLRKDQEDAA